MSSLTSNPIEPEGPAQHPAQVRSSDIADPAGDPIARAAAAADASAKGDIVTIGADATRRASIDTERSSGVIADGFRARM